MQIKSLKINRQLCLVDFEINFNAINTENGGSATFLIGENGTGKSTMFESVLEILMSFDSPMIENQIDYDYSIEYYYAQTLHFIKKEDRNYYIVSGDDVCEGNYKKVKNFTKSHSMFPKRVIAFYSGANNKLDLHINKINKQYKILCKETIVKFLKSMNDDSERFLPNFPKRKYNYCNETLTPIYLAAILCGQDSFEKRYLNKNCFFEKVDYIDMIINVDKVEQILGRGKFDGDIPVGLYYLTDFIDQRFTEVLRRGFWGASSNKAIFEIEEIENIGADSISILEFFEKLHTLFDAQFEVTVTQGSSSVTCNKMSEGQRQLIKILGMLCISKTEDCLVLMDEPDAHMNPRWKYEIKDTILEALEMSVNTQALIATHDPLVINGVPKEYIRIFTHNEAERQNNGFYITQVIEPIEDTVGMGIDGLLQSEYYRLRTSYDKKATGKFLRRQELYEKLINRNISAEEKAELRALTKEVASMQMSNNSIDFLYDDFIKVFRNTEYYKKEYLSFDKIQERRKTIERIIKELYEGQK